VYAILLHECVQYFTYNYFGIEMIIKYNQWKYYDINYDFLFYIVIFTTVNWTSVQSNLEPI